MFKMIMKRLTAVLLMLVMMLGIVPAFSVSAAYENTHVNTGNQAYDIVAVAKTQVGYTEGSNNDTKYNRWFGSLPSYGYNYAWCQTFVAWCANQAGISTSDIARVSGTVSGMDSYKNNGTWHNGPYYGASYTPKQGDIIYFKSSASNSGYHVGIVSDCYNGTVYTIEGNAGSSTDRVITSSYSVSSTKIVGYGVPFSGETASLVTPTITTDKASYTVGDTVYLSWTASPSNSNLSHYWLIIDAPDGTRILNETMSLNTSYSFTVTQTGNYTITSFATPQGSTDGSGSLTDTVTIAVNAKDINYSMSLSDSSITISDIDQSATVTLTIIGDMSNGGIVGFDSSGCDSIASITYNGDGEKYSDHFTGSFTVTSKASGSGNCLFYVKIDEKIIASTNLQINVNDRKCMVEWNQNYSGSSSGWTIYYWGDEIGASAYICQEREGYTFVGWSTIPNDPDENYIISSDFVIPQQNELILYAQWVKTSGLPALYFGEGYEPTLYEVTLEELENSDYSAKIPVYITEDWYSYRFGAQWNSDELTFKTIERTEDSINTIISTNLYETGERLWFQMDSLESTTIPAGHCYNMIFNVNSSAKVGDAYIIRATGTKTEEDGEKFQITTANGTKYLNVENAIAVIYIKEPTYTTTTTTTSTTTSTTAKTTTTSATTTTASDDFTVVYGDVNLDKIISMSDLVYLNKAIAKILALNSEQSANADCVADGIISTGDAQALLKFLVLSIEKLPINPS